MLIQLQPIQISLMWNAISDSLVKANQIPEDRQARYVNESLKKLLSGTHQCWVVFSNDEEAERRINAIGITAIIEDKLFNTKNLHVMSLYGYRLLTDEIASESFEKLREYARANKCEKITMETSVSRIKVLAKLVGFSQTSSNYSLYL